MPEEELSARVEEVERRLSRVEKQVFAFQVVAAKKLNEALEAIKEYEKIRDEKLKEALERMMRGMEEIRGFFDLITNPPKGN